MNILPVVALSEEQRALLQLLLEEGEGYDDLATLLNVAAPEVRARAAVALARLDGREGLAGGSWQADYLLGQATENVAATVEANLAGDEEALAQTRRITARLRLLFPSASLPAPPAVSGAAGEGASAPLEPNGTPEAHQSEAAETAVPRPDDQPEASEGTAPPPAEVTTVDEPLGEANNRQGPVPEVPDVPAPEVPVAPEVPAPSEPVGNTAIAQPSLSRQQKRLLALLTAVLLSVVIIVLALAGAFEGNSSAGSGEATTTQSQGTSSDETQLTRAVLEPQGRSSGSGVAIFGAVDEQTPVLQVTAEGLEATDEGEEYSIWLYGNDRIALRLAGVEVGRNGQIATQIELPAEALNFVVDRTLDQIDISRNRKPAYRKELRAAERQGRLPQRIGTSVLRGPITGPGLTATQ